jgi:hypothetical protein
MIIKGNQESELLEAEPAAKFLGGWRHAFLIGIVIGRSTARCYAILFFYWIAPIMN